MISKAWTEHQEIRNVMLFLQSHQISTLFAVKIYKTYGNEAIDIVKTNPYRLAEDIYGIGFFSADKVALSLGLQPDAPERIQAAIHHVLQSAREEGHCYLTQEQVTTGVAELLSLPNESAIDATLQRLEQKGELMIRRLPDGKGTLQKCFYAHSLYFDEQYIATKAKQLVTLPVAIHKEILEEQLDLYCGFHRLTLSEEQRSSVLQIAATRLSILTGGPGCGKTTTTRALVGLLQRLGKNVLLAAPTGRAAQRMSEVIGVEAKTIHRLLEWDPAKGGFKRGEHSPLNTDVLILDECSMLDVHLAAAVLRAVSLDTQVVLIGDADQLPAVGAGNVLQDLVSSGVVPSHRLTKVFRQAAQSLIISYAHEINKGEVPRIESPFHKPQAWQQGIDCLFIDSEEATQEQLRFIAKVKQQAGEPSKGQAPVSNLLEEPDAADQYTNESSFSLPVRFSHVDLDALLRAEGHTEELKQVLRRVHPWSSLHYGLSAAAMVERLYRETIPKYLGRGVEVQILSPMTKGSLGTASLNSLIQESVNGAREGKGQLSVGGRVFREGDRVIQKRNNYDLGVFNGDIGVVTAVESEALELVVSFPAGKEQKEVTYAKEHLLELDLAYAITVHKAQGSEFEAIIIPIVSQHFNLLFRNLVYTGITRAKRLVVFVGTRKALTMAIGKQTTTLRQTALAYLLTQ
jgi:exodeoxyribonuclease V alpha subunit